MIVPGTAHPEPPQSAAVMARRIGVSVKRLRADFGHTDIDPFAALTWASWNGVASVRRRWQRWVQWMTAPQRLLSRRMMIQRRHRAFFPATIRGILRGWLPAVSGGTCVTIDQSVTEPWQYEQKHDMMLHVAGGEADADLTALMYELAGTFRYGYRHHDPWDIPSPQWRDEGTCLDACLSLAHLLEAHHRQWRLHSGVTASTAYANPHFWIEAETIGGVWCQLDPTVPAIARMAGLDWVTLIPAACGQRDTRRVVLDHETAPDIARGTEAFVGLLRIDDQPATACLDWACGRCEWRFENVA